MKRKLSVLMICVSAVLIFSGCDQQDDTSETQRYFLSDIRPQFFDNLDFQSETIVANIAQFKTNLADTYKELETAYERGEYTSENDLEYMRLSSMYYCFYLLALGGNYNDGNLSFQQIAGNVQTGYYSDLPASGPDFEQKELEAMMKEAARVGEIAYSINGFNDKAYGFYLSVRQVEERLKNKGASNSPEVQNLVIDYVGTRMVNFDLLPDWNVLMAMVTFTNYKDSLNTFKNPAMNSVLFNVNARLVPGLLPDLGGLYPEILGPLYRYDLNMKKMDWYIETTETFTEKEISELDTYIKTLETASTFIETERGEILQSWDDLYTYQMRKDKLLEVKNFSNQLKEGIQNLQKPELKTFLNSKDFKRAYQCYSCHKPTGLNY